jgi:hypothetical protein
VGPRGSDGATPNVSGLQTAINKIRNSLSQYVRKNEPVKLQAKNGELDNYFARCGQGDNARDTQVGCGGGHGGQHREWRIVNL